MTTCTMTEFKRLTVAQMKAMFPIEITSDGELFATIDKPKGREKSMVGTPTQCPNCKMEFRVKPPDGKPWFFTMKHP